MTPATISPPFVALHKGLLAPALVVALLVGGCGGSTTTSSSSGSNKPQKATATTNSNPSPKPSACNGAHSQYFALRGDIASVRKTVSHPSTSARPLDMAPLDKLEADAATLKTTFSELRSSATAAQQAQIDQYKSALDSLQRAEWAYHASDYTTGNSELAGSAPQIRPMGHLITTLCG